MHHLYCLIYPTVTLPNHFCFTKAYSVSAKGASKTGPSMLAKRRRCKQDKTTICVDSPLTPFSYTHTHRDMPLRAAQRLDAGVVRALKVSSFCLSAFPLLCLPQPLSSCMSPFASPWATQVLVLLFCVSSPHLWLYNLVPLSATALLSLLPAFFPHLSSPFLLRFPSPRLGLSAIRPYPRPGG